MKISFYPNSVLDWPNPFWRILAANLRKKGVKVVKVPFCFFNLFWKRKEVKVINFHYPYTENFSLRLPKSLHDLLFKLIKGFRKRLFIPRLKFAKILGYKIVYTAHNTKPHLKEDKLSKKNKEELYRLSDKIIVMGKNDKKIIEKIYPDKKIEIIPHFSYAGSYKNDVSKKYARKKLGISNNEFVYLFFGAIRRYKGVKDLVIAFNKINKGKLIIAGDASHERDYVDMVRNLSKKNKKIDLYDKNISEKEMQIFMNAADVAVFPFKQISNSGSLILAKSFYRPTIFFAKGNTKDIFNPKTDIMIKDEKDLSNSLLQAQKKKFSKDKKEYLKGIPSAEEVAKMYKEVY